MLVLVLEWRRPECLSAGVVSLVVSVLPNLVPKGLNEGSQAICCLGAYPKKDPTRRDGVRRCSAFFSSEVMFV